MRIGIAKETTPFRGGFELLTARIATALGRRGHDVGWIEPVPFDQPFQDVPETVRSEAPEYFRYVEQIEGFRRARADVDVVLSTQPPSQAVEHRPQVALFYHHLRQYYDLSDVWVEAGFANAASHTVCERSVRRLDEPLFAGTSFFLAGSETVMHRLERYNGVGSITEVLRAPPLRQVPSVAPNLNGRHVLCVSRHEFPKRTELAVAAMKLVPDVDAVFVGAGGRLGWVMSEDRRWTGMDPADVAALSPKEIWLRRHEWMPESEVDPRSNVRFAGWTAEDDLDALYRDAFCVIAPAFDEDYGLTALEAMAHSTPVIVCSDGGGLVDTVTEGESGLIVQPDHNAIASAITRLRGDPDLAAELGQRGRVSVADLDWTTYVDRIEASLAAQT